MNWRSLIALLLINTANATEWESSLATIPALRTGGADLVSSDALEIDGGRYALITYWEVRSQNDLDFYRCVDIADSRFATVHQDCWKALRPTGRAPTTVSDVTSSDDLCGRRSVPGNEENAAFCTFSRSFNLKTPYFEIALSPFENGGLVAVREQGRNLIVADGELPASVLLNVRAGTLRDEPELSGISETNDFVTNAPEGLKCAVEEIAGREWAVCHQDSIPTDVVRYSIEGDMVYQVGFGADLSEGDLAIVRATILSLRLSPH